MVADERIRELLTPVLEPIAAAAARAGVTPNQLTAVGLLFALSSAVAAGRAAWVPAAVLWLLSRLPDGLDGVLARLTGRDSDVGGLLDVLADFLGYGAFVLGVAVGAPEARVACAALLLTYYLNGTAFLAIAGLAERRAQQIAAGERSLQFVGGLAEGFETILAHALLALVAEIAPARLPLAVWLFTAMVAVTVLQRVRFGVRVLRDD